jgi:phosphoribosyl 1,2-cyclic phosphodiesterase
MKLSGYKKNNEELYIFLSHYHWDHIQGIPFSALIFTQNKMKFVGMKGDENTNVKDILEGQMNKYNFPISLDFMNKNISFFEIDKTAKIGEYTEIIAYPMEHPLIGSLTYKIRDIETGKSIVYSTDFEQPPDKLEKKLIEICKGSDVLIIDAHFTPGESTNYQGWGHGNFGNAIDLARLSGIKELILFHHNFNKTDKELYKTELDIRGYLNVSKDSFPDFNLKVNLAYEGLEIII